MTDEYKTTFSVEGRENGKQLKGHAASKIFVSS